MTHRQLLVHLDAGGRNVHRLQAARAIAAAEGAAVAALYAVVPSVVEAPYAGELAPQLIESLDAWDRERRDRARKAFDVENRGPGVPVTWAEAAGMGTVAEFAGQALYADLLVLGQHDPAQPAGAPSDFNEAVLLASGKPALVLPYTGWDRPIGQTAVIAWKDTPQAARAVASALPLLRRADRVHVLRWGAAADTSVSGEVLDLRGYLRRHGVEATWHDRGEEPAELPELMLSQAFDLAADLLVMGCYGHSRMRELVLGGMSRTILRSMTLPVFMAH